MRNRFLILHNARAGGLMRSPYEQLVRKLRQTGAALDIVETHPANDVRRQLQKALQGEGTISAKYDAVVAAGGDGTIHAVACALLEMKKPPPLAIIPLGTGNVLARELGIRAAKTDLLAMLREAPVRHMPVGRVNEHCFLSVVGVGFDAEAVRHFEEGHMRALGQVGFVLPVLQALGRQSGEVLRVTVNDRTLKVHWVIVTRGKHYAANLLLTPDADPFGNGFHIICFKGAGAMMRLRQLTALFSGLISHDPTIEIIKTKAAMIEGAQTTCVQIDGESMGELPLYISMHKRTLPLIVPDFV